MQIDFLERLKARPMDRLFESREWNEITTNKVLLSSEAMEDDDDVVGEVLLFVEQSSLWLVRKLELERGNKREQPVPSRLDPLAPTRDEQQDVEIVKDQLFPVEPPPCRRSFANKESGHPAALGT